MENTILQLPEPTLLEEVNMVIDYPFYIFRSLTNAYSDSHDYAILAIYLVGCLLILVKQSRLNGKLWLAAFTLVSGVQFGFPYQSFMYDLLGNYVFIYVSILFFTVFFALCMFFVKNVTTFSLSDLWCGKKPLHPIIAVTASVLFIYAFVCFSYIDSTYMVIYYAVILSSILIYIYSKLAVKSYRLYLWLTLSFIAGMAVLKVENNIQIGAYIIAWSDAEVCFSIASKLLAVFLIVGFIYMSKLHAKWYLYIILLLPIMVEVYNITHDIYLAEHVLWVLPLVFALFVLENTWVDNHRLSTASVFFSFSERIARSQYIAFTNMFSFYIIFFYVNSKSSGLFGPDKSLNSVFGYAFLIVNFFVSILLTIHRIKHAGLSIKWLFYLFIPLLNTLSYIYLCVKPGESGDKTTSV